MAATDFKTKMNRLEAIVSTLEKGDTELEAALTLYEEGTRLIQECGETLAAAEQKVRLLTEDHREIPFNNEVE